MKRKRLFSLCSIALVTMLVALAIAGCQAPAVTPTPTPTPTPEAKTLQIGGLMSLTQFFSLHDIPDWNQALIAADLMNERGGITVNGQKYVVELVAEDTKSSIDGVTAAANRLVYDKGIKFIIGPCAFFSSGAGPVTDPAKVIRAITWSVNTPGEMDATTPYAFLGINASAANAYATVKYLTQAYPNVKKIALVQADDGAIPFLGPIFRDAWQAKGVTVVGDIVAFPNEMQDFSPIAAKLNAIKDADAINLVTGLSNSIGGIIKGLRELGYNKPFAISSGNVSLNEVATIAGKGALNDVFATCWTPEDPNMPPLAKEICVRTQAKYGADYTLYLTAAESLWSLKYAIEAAQSLDPTVVKEKWESMNTIDNIFGTGVVCGEKTYGIRHATAHPQGIQIYENGMTKSAGIVDIGVIP